MRVRFVSQPFVGGFDLRDYLLHAATEAGMEELTIVVAWAKRSGLRLFGDALAAFRAAGGRTRLLVGISEGGATRQGLELALEMFDAVSVVHDVADVTFHPKVYLARGPTTALALVGSHNLTAGGAFANHEAGVYLELDLAVAEDAAFVADIAAYVDRLVGDAALCVSLTPEVLARLIAEPAWRIGDEDVPRSGSSGAPGAAAAGGGAPLFTRTSAARRGRPGAPTGTGGDTVVPPPIVTLVPGTATPPPGTPPTPAPRVVHRWTKRLAAADAQHPVGPKSHPLGHLTLVTAGHDFDRTTWFRYTLFKDLGWHAVGAPREEADVEFEVVLHGKALGPFTLTLMYDPRMAAGQDNRTTVLRWGPLQGLLRSQDLTREFVSLEGLDDGTYRLTLDTTPTGPFLG